MKTGPDTKTPIRELESLAHELRALLAENPQRPGAESMRADLDFIAAERRTHWRVIEGGKAHVS